MYDSVLKLASNQFCKYCRFWSGQMYVAAPHLAAMLSLVECHYSLFAHLGGQYAEEGCESAGYWVCLEAWHYQTAWLLIKSLFGNWKISEIWVNSESKFRLIELIQASKRYHTFFWVTLYNNVLWKLMSFEISNIRPMQIYIYNKDGQEALMTCLQSF